MPSSDPAFGRMLRQLVDLGVLKLETEPLDAVIERRLKQFWGSRTCPRCGNPTVRSWESTDRVHCRSCQFKPVYTYGTPFHEKHLSCGEVLLSFMLYADTLLSISQIAVVLDRAYKTVFYAIKEVETAVHRGFPPRLESVSARNLWANTDRRVRKGLFRVQRPRPAARQPSSRRVVPNRANTVEGSSRRSINARRGLPRRAPSDSWEARNRLRDRFRAGDGGNSRPLPATGRGLDRRSPSLSSNGARIHINQVECLFSLVKPWLRKFRGLSKHGLEQAAHTFGIVRSVNLIGASFEFLVDCLAIGGLHSST